MQRRLFKGLINNTDAMLLYDRIADKSGFLQYRKLI